MIRPITVHILGNKVKLSKTLSAASRNLQSFGKSARKAGRSLTFGVTAPVLGLGVTVVRTAAQFEKSMNRVGAVSGATGKEMADLTATARELGSSTQFSASEAAEAMAFLGQAGFKTDQILGAIPGTLQLASSAQLELGQSADIVTNILSGYGLEVSDLARVNDVLVKTFTSSNTDLVQLGEAMKLAGPIASGMKIEFEETAAALGLLGNAGFQASLGGTALRGGLLRLSNPSKDARKALAEIGIPLKNLVDSSGNVRSLATLVEEFEKKAASAGQFSRIFGQRAGPALAVLVSQGSGALSKLTGELKDAGGTAQRISEAQMKGAAGAMKEFSSAVEGLQLSIATSGILEWVTDLTKKLSGFVQRLSKTSPATLKWVTVLALAAAALGPVVVGIGLAAQGIAALIPVIAVMKAGFLALNLVMIANPIGLIVAGAAALIGIGVVLFKKWEPFRDLILGIWNRIKNIGSLASSFVPDFIRDSFSGVGPGLGGVDADGGAAARGGVFTAPPQAQVGGRVEIEIREDRPARVRRLESSAPGFDLDVLQGPALAGAG